MLTALIGFVTSNVFRMVWGEVSSWLTAKQEHRQEIERMRLQMEMDEASHARTQQAIRTQHEMGVEVIRISSEARLEEMGAEAFGEGVKLTGKKSGVAWVDAWNSVIRPAVATWSLLMMTSHYLKWITLDETGWALCGAALGLYLANRDLFKRNK